MRIQIGCSQPTGTEFINPFPMADIASGRTPLANRKMDFQNARSSIQRLVAAQLDGDTGPLPLNLAGYTLDGLPPEIGQLHALTSLHAYRTGLRSLPDELGQLARLQRLILSGNRLQAIPSTVGQLHQLTHLYLQENSLASLPPEIGQLSNLVHLNVSRNRLTSLPPEIGNLKNLRYLYLSRNSLVNLPETFSNLTALRTVTIHLNRFTSTPAGLFASSRRQELHIDGYLAQSLPEDLQRLPSLTRLVLRFFPNRTDGKADCAGQIVR